MMRHLERGLVFGVVGVRAFVVAWVLTGLVFVAEVAAQTPSLIRTDAPVVTLNHVAVIYGTGAEAVQDQTVLIRDGDIEAVGVFGSVQVPSGAETFDLSGHTVMPGRAGSRQDRRCRS